MPVSYTHLDVYKRQMYLLARVIKSMGIKMVLSGEGADAVFGGYLYFHKAPQPQAVSYTHLEQCTTGYSLQHPLQRFQNSETTLAV